MGQSRQTSAVCPAAVGFPKGAGAGFPEAFTFSRGERAWAVRSCSPVRMTPAPVTSPDQPVSSVRQRLRGAKPRGRIVDHLSGRADVPASRRLGLLNLPALLWCPSVLLSVLSATVDIEPRSARRFPSEGRSSAVGLDASGSYDTVVRLAMLLAAGRPGCVLSLYSESRCEAGLLLFDRYQQRRSTRHAPTSSDQGHEDLDQGQRSARRSDVHVTGQPDLVTVSTAPSVSIICIRFFTPLQRCWYSSSTTTAISGGSVILQLRSAGFETQGASNGRRRSRRPAPTSLRGLARRHSARRLRLHDLSSPAREFAADITIFFVSGDRTETYDRDAGLLVGSRQLHREAVRRRRADRICPRVVEPFEDLRRQPDRTRA